MAHLLKRGTNILRYGNNVFRVKDRLGTYSLTTTVYTSGGSRGITLDTPSNRLFVANFSANTVSVIDMDTLAITATITGFSAPTYIEMDYPNNRCLVMNSSALRIDAINLTTLARTTFLTTLSQYFAMALDMANNRIFVTPSTGFVYTINATTGAVINSVSGYSNLLGIVYDAAGGRLFTCSSASLLVLNAADLSQIFLGPGVYNGARQLAANYSEKRGFISCYGVNRVECFDLTTYGSLTGLTLPTIAHQGVAVNTPTGKIYNITDSSRLTVLTPIIT